MASYLINALAQVTSALRPARPIPAYYLVLGNEPLAHGLRPGIQVWWPTLLSAHGFDEATKPERYS